MNKAEVMSLIEQATGMYTLEVPEHAALYDLLENEASLHSGGVILELGVCFGRTSIMLAYLAKHKQMEYHGIDIFILCKESDFRSALDATGLPYTLHIGFTTGYRTPQLWEALPNVKEVAWDRPISFLFIDASHQDPWFSADCAKYLPLLEPGGIVAFDDWESDSVGPHVDVRVQGEKFTVGWDDVAWINGRVRLKRKPIIADK